MSHYALLVVTRYEPTDEVLSKHLQPFHEFECTGEDDEYVQNVDNTERVRDEYETDRAILVVRRPDGFEFYAFGTDGNYVEELRQFLVPDDKESFRDVLKLPEGWEEVRGERLTKDYVNFFDFVKSKYGFKTTKDAINTADSDLHEYGYIVVDDRGDVVRVINRTNPNKKWDRWTVGGRYSDRFGPGINTVQIGNVDLEAMRAEKVRERRARIDEKVAKGEFAGYGDLEVAIEMFDEIKARWTDLPEPRPRGDEYEEWIKSQSAAAARFHSTLDWFEELDLDGKTIEEWINSPPCLSAYAILDADGNWIANGEMGRFGVSHGQKLTSCQWNDFVDKFVRELPEGTWLTYVDCHT